MPTPRHSFGFVWLPATYNVYAIGGMLGWQDAVTATERYEACSKSWTLMAQLPQPRGYVQAAELNGTSMSLAGSIASFPTPIRFIMKHGSMIRSATRGRKPQIFPRRWAAWRWLW